MSVRSSVSLSVCLCPSVCLSVRLSLSVSLCSLSVCLVSRYWPVALRHRGFAAVYPAGQLLHGRRSAAVAPQHGGQQHTRAVSRCQLTYEAESTTRCTCYGAALGNTLSSWSIVAVLRRLLSNNCRCVFFKHLRTLSMRLCTPALILLCTDATHTHTHTTV